MQLPLTPLAVLLAVVATPQDDDKAQALLERAEARYAQGRYPEVLRAYRELAEKYPNTDAGRIGVRRSGENSFLGYERIIENGPPAKRIDIVLMNDGYLVGKQKAWDKLAADLPRCFERQEPFTEYLSYFNFVRCNLASADDNVTGFGRSASTALGGHVIESVQGHTAIDPSLVTAMLSEVPFEEQDGLVFAVVRAGSHGTGGGGIACIGAQETKIAMHEWGHAFAGLGDEYLEQTHSRSKGALYPNVAYNDDPKLVPWAHWIEAKARGIGVYEGADGQARGAWKPKPSGCVMQDSEFYCEPCREAIVLRIYSIVDPIETSNIPGHGDDSALELELTETLDFELLVMRPESHKLEVDWYVLPEGTQPAAPTPMLANAKDRRARGPLVQIDAKPKQSNPADNQGRSRFSLKPSDLEPGRYRVIARVTDETRLRGEKLPWVLKDEHGVLQSERGWWVRVP